MTLACTPELTAHPGGQATPTETSLVYLERDLDPTLKPQAQLTRRSCKRTQAWESRAQNSTLNPKQSSPGTVARASTQHATPEQSSPVDLGGQLIPEGGRLLLAQSQHLLQR